MLNNFPKLYPGEWWYSVLCRYYLSTGIKESALVKEQLFGSKTCMMAPLFPNRTIYQVVKQLPQDAFAFDDIVQHHTLYRYYMRFFPKIEQGSMYRSLLVGGSPKLTHMRVNYGLENFAPRYCPLCIKEDAEKFGQAYYHINHQIPMISICNKHKVKLKQISLAEKSTFISSFRPLSLESVDMNPENGSDGEIIAAEIASEFLARSLTIGPTEGYNNLITGLINNGYYRFDSVAGLTVDSEKILCSLRKLYGDTLTLKVFSKHMPNNLMLSIRRFSQIMPDRYVLLLGLTGMSFDDFLVKGQIECEMKRRLMDVQKSADIKTINDAANMMQLQEYEVRALCKYYNVMPFWTEQNSYVRSNVIKKRVTCMVTEEDYEKLYAVARSHGFTAPGEYLVKTALSIAGDIGKAE